MNRQDSKGVGKNGVRRKVAKARSQREKAISAEAACKEDWRNGIEYFGAVVKESLGEAAVASAGMEEPVEVSNAQAAILMTNALALRAAFKTLLGEATRDEAFEEAATFMDEAPSTVQDWERAYRAKGYIEVTAGL